MKSTYLRLLIDHGGGPSVCTLKHACTIIERRTILGHQLGGAARWVHLGLRGALPWCAPPHAEASNVEANTRVACHCTVAGVEGGDGLALVDRLDALIWEFAKATVGTVEVANLLGQAIAVEESLDVGITRSSWHWSAQASLGPLNALLVIDVASAPLVSDRVALRQALVHIEAIWHLGDAHHIAVVVVLAGTLEANDLVIQRHLLAFCITRLLPIGPARPHPAISAVAGTGVVVDRALTGEGRDGEAIRPFLLVNSELVQRIVTPARLVFLDVCTTCGSNGDNRKNDGAHFYESVWEKNEN